MSMKNCKNEKSTLQANYNGKENRHITKSEIKQRTLTNLAFKTCKNIECGNEERQNQNKNIKMERHKSERKLKIKI